MKVRIHQGYIDVWIDREFEEWYPHSYMDADIPDEVLDRWERAINEYHNAQVALENYLEGKWVRPEWPGRSEGNAPNPSG